MRRCEGSEIRRIFLSFFAKRGHTVVPSSSLVPKADPTLLFTNAGMVQFKDVFLGLEKRSYTRAASCQKCVRAGGKHNDLENVGRTARHHTFFEMLGNFSFGDYFKEEAIEYAWELLTVDFGLSPERLWATIFQDDDEAFELWQKIAGLPAERIVRLGEKDNFWAMGETGPCGPCSELVFDQGPGIGCGRPECDLTCGCDRYLELWNLVFMQYNRNPDGTLTPLPKPSIDTGAGLERLAAVLQGVASNFETDLLRPVIARVEELTEKRYGKDPKADVSMRVIADHARAVTFLVSDGVLPSNEGRGYVLRRILRRALRHGRLLGLEEPFLAKVSETVVTVMGEAYPELEATKTQVGRVLLAEEERFTRTLQVGLERVEELFQDLKGQGAEIVPGEAIFKLYDTYGFPLDLLQDLAQEQGFALDEEGFAQEMALQRKRAKAALLLKAGDVAAPEIYRDLSRRVSVQFTGYDRLEGEALVVALVKEGRPIETAGPGEEVEVILDETPFYAEAGGQVGDVGALIGEGVFCEVLDTKAPVPGLHVHRGRVRHGTLKVGAQVKARVEG
ncbi:MAG: alanine--tRNA ligase, partial [Candidatus Methylomirabilales bacterium]